MRIVIFYFLLWSCFFPPSPFPYFLSVIHYILCTWIFTKLFMWIKVLSLIKLGVFTHIFHWIYFFLSFVITHTLVCLIMPYIFLRTLIIFFFLFFSMLFRLYCLFICFEVYFFVVVFQFICAVVPHWYCWVLRVHFPFQSFFLSV